MIERLLDHQTCVSWRVRVGHFLSPPEGYPLSSHFVAHRYVCTKGGVAHFPSVHIPLSLPLIKKQSQREFNLVFAMISLSVSLLSPSLNPVYIFLLEKGDAYVSLFISSLVH